MLVKKLITITKIIKNISIYLSGVLTLIIIFFIFPVDEKTKLNHQQIVAEFKVNTFFFFFFRINFHGFEDVMN